MVIFLAGHKRCALFWQWRHMEVPLVALLSRSGHMGEGINTWAGDKTVSKTKQLYGTAWDRGRKNRTLDICGER